MLASPVPAVRVGQTLAQRYCIQRLLGEGAVGTVFQAEDLQRHGLVALKVLKASVCGDRLVLERFRREIQATMRLDCEYVVRTLGVDYLEDETPFMVMEYLNALDLSKVIASNGPLAVDKAIGFALQICVALAHAHHQGIVHRDIKPANLLLVRQPNSRELVKVADFGISKLVPNTFHGQIQKLTGNAVRLGSPTYMSPEQQTLGREVDARTDIWALGITLFEMLVGVTPFDSSPQAIRSESESPSSVPSVSRHRAGIPHGMDAIIAMCLQRLPEHRFQNVAELAVALAPYAAPGLARLPGEVTQLLGPQKFSVAPRAVPTSVRGDTLDGAGTTLGPTIAPGSGTARVNPRLWHRLGWFVGVLSIGVVGAAGSGLLWRPSNREPMLYARRYAALPVSSSWTKHTSTSVMGSSVAHTTEPRPASRHQAATDVGAGHPTAAPPIASINGGATPTPTPSSTIPAIEATAQPATAIATAAYQPDLGY